MAKKNIETKRQSREDKRAQAAAQNIIIQPSRIETADVGKWKMYVNEALQGNRTGLYNMYSNLLSDGFLSDAIDKLVGSVTNAEIIFQKDGNSVEPIDDMIDTPEFETFIREIALSKVWGKSVIDVMFYPDFDIFSFPRKHIIIKGIGKPLRERKKFIAEREIDTSGYDFTKDEYIIECGEDDDLGLLYKAAPYVIYKRGGFGDWAQFVELFGQPFRIAQYDSFDTTTRDLLLQALKEMGGAPYAAVPKEAKFEIINGAGGNSNVFKMFRDACNEEILIAILGNTMTTLNGSSRSQAEVHKQSEEDKFQALRRYVQRMLNRYFVPLLVKRGYDAAGGFFLFPDAGENISTKERLEIAIKLKNDAGVKVDDDYFYEITGVPKADVSDPKEDEKTAEDKPEDNNTVKKEEEEKKQTEEQEAVSRTVISAVSEFFKGLGDFFAGAPTARSGADRKQRKTLIRRITGKIKLDDDYSINIDKLLSEALREVYGNKGDELVNEKLFDITNNALQHGIDISLSELGETDGEFIRQFKENAAVFSAFKNHQQTKDIAALLYDEDGKLRPFGKFKKLALRVSEDYNELWLRTEYNTAVRRAATAANLKRWEKTLHLYPNLEYLETNSANPRQSHKHYVGTILPFYLEWWDTHMPPSDWECDCGVRPTDKEPTAVPPDYGGVNPLFAQNPAESAAFVKTEETPYFQHTDEKLRTQVAQEGRRLLAEQQNAIIEIYKGKNGGFLEIVKQQGNEREKNIVTYKMLADDGNKYSLLRPANISGVRNPDAFNYNKGMFSDAKHPVTESGKNAIQNSIRAAAKQKVGEVVIRLETDYSSAEIHEGLKAALQQGRADELERIVIIRKGSKPLYLDAQELRKRFKGKK